MNVLAQTGGSTDDGSLDEAGYQIRRGSGGEWAIQETIVESAETLTAMRGNKQRDPAREPITKTAKREKQITAPVISATITMLYSMSFPVLKVLSQ